VICLLEGKVVTGVTGIILSVVTLAGAIRLAKPGSGGRGTAMPAGRAVPGAPHAATASITRSAGTGCEISSPAPPPSKGQADSADHHTSALPAAGQDTRQRAPTYQFCAPKARDAKHAALAQNGG
jgi:hypothetical protein